MGARKVWAWAAEQEQPGWLRGAIAAGLAAMALVSLAANVPWRLEEAHGFYGITRAQLQPIEQAALEDALVIVYAERWLEYGAMLAGQSPLLDDEVVYARGSNATIDAEVIAQFAGRDVYYLHNGALSRTPP